MQDNSFIAAIIAEPDNVDIRLVFADHLEERGDVRSEFIRIQCELATIATWDATAAILHEREQSLIKENLRIWNSDVHRFLSRNGLKNRAGSRRQPIRSWSYRRGFIEVLEVNEDFYRDHADILLQIGPVQHLKFNRASAFAYQNLASLPGLNRMRSLRVHEQPATPRIPLLGWLQDRQVEYVRDVVTSDWELPSVTTSGVCVTGERYQHEMQSGVIADLIARADHSAAIHRVVRGPIDALDSLNAGIDSCLSALTKRAFN